MNLKSSKKKKDKISIFMSFLIYYNNQKSYNYPLTNSMAYEIRRFNTAFRRALQ